MDLNELLNNNISKPTNEIEINKIDIYLKQRTGRNMLQRFLELILMIKKD